MSTKDFQILSKIGEGAYSSVWKVKRISDGQEYAMKKVKLTPLTEKEKQNALNEVRILASIKNPCIIAYKEAFYEENPMTLCIVMEYAGGGDMLNKITQNQKHNRLFKEEDIWRIAVQMILGLKALHDMKILHRDLKCANVFLSADGKNVKLGDLNVSKVTKNNLAHTQTGTPYYASPEVWKDQPYDMKSDIWSLGCVIYEMCALKPPFTANDMQGLYKKVQRGVFDRIPQQYSVDLYNFISMCLQVKPSARPTCDQLLSHPIIQKNAGKLIQGMLGEVDGIEDSGELLGTIRVPANMKALANKLPKANYTQQSPPSERGKGKKGNEKNGNRPISQSTPKSRDGVLVRESQSRESRVQEMQKINPTNGSGRRGEQQREQRIVRRGVELPGPQQKSPTSKGLNEKKVMESIQNLDRQLEEKNIFAKEESSWNGDHIDYYRKANVLERRRAALGEDNRNGGSMIPLIRPSVNKREESGVEKLISYKQDYLINKYQNREKGDEKRSLPRIDSEKEHMLLKRAEYLLDKYQAIDSVKKDASRVVETKKANGNLFNAHKRDQSDILEKYANILGNKDGNVRGYGAYENPQAILNRKVDYQYLNQNSYMHTPSKRNNSNHDTEVNVANIRLQPQTKEVLKPVWWG